MAKPVINFSIGDKKQQHDPSEYDADGKGALWKVEPKTPKHPNLSGYICKAKEDGTFDYYWVSAWMNESDATDFPF